MYIAFQLYHASSFLPRIQKSKLTRFAFYVSVKVYVCGDQVSTLFSLLSKQILNVPVSFSCVSARKSESKKEQKKNCKKQKE